MFSKRHYEAVAEAMQRAYADHGELNRPQWEACVQELSNTFARDNAAFNRNRFDAACEPGANVKARTRYKLPQGVTAVSLDDPAKLHATIAKEIGEGFDADDVDTYPGQNVWKREGL